MRHLGDHISVVSLRDYQPLDEVFDGWCISSVYVVEQMAIAHRFQLNRGIVIEVLFVEAHRHILNRVSVLNEFVESCGHFQLEVVPAVSASNERSWGRS